MYSIRLIIYFIFVTEYYECIISMWCLRSFWYIWIIERLVGAKGMKIDLFKFSHQYLSIDFSIETIIWSKELYYHIIFVFGILFTNWSVLHPATRRSIWILSEPIRKCNITVQIYSQSRLNWQRYHHMTTHIGILCPMEHAHGCVASFFFFGGGAILVIISWCWWNFLPQPIRSTEFGHATSQGYATHEPVAMETRS